MYRETFQLALKLYPYVVAVILCSFTGEFMEEMGVSVENPWMIVNFGTGAVLAFATCILVLLRPAETGPLNLISHVDSFTMLRFMWRLLPLTILLNTVENVLIFVASRTAGYAFHDLGQPRWQAIGETVMKVYLFEYAVFLLLFSVFGVMLPATVANGNRGFKASYKRAVSQFGGVLIRLIIGPILLHFIGVLLGTAVVIGEPAATSLLFDGWIPNIIGIALFLMQSALWAWAVVMTFWILSKAYLKAEYGAKGMQVVRRF